MKRVIVEIYDGKPSIEDERAIHIPSQDYFDFIQKLDTQKLNYFSKSFKLVCEKCKAYMIDTKVFEAIFSELDYFSGELREYLDLPEEDLIKLDSGALEKEGMIEDEDGNIYKYRSNEVAFVFDKNCNCHKVLVGE